MARVAPGAAYRTGRLKPAKPHIFYMERDFALFLHKIAIFSHQNRKKMRIKPIKPKWEEDFVENEWEIGKNAIKPTWDSYFYKSQYFTIKGERE